MKHHPRNLMEEADVRIHGDRPWDIRVHDERLWRRLALFGGVGLGDAYVDGWWDAEAVDELICKLAYAFRYRTHGACWVRLMGFAQSRMLNLQSLKRAFEVGQRHYDIGNELYERMLDARLVYSCGYWRDGAETLARAQERKLDLVCRKLGLQPGMRVLDIGSGWGSFCEYAARNYGVEVVGLTVSKEQQAYSMRICKDLPVEILLRDYRLHEGVYDRIASIGMFEHVGLKNYPVYFDVVRRCLKPDGLFLLHTIGAPMSSNNANSWHAKRIFPNGFLPSITQISRALEKRLVTEDLHNFGADYDPTLMAWMRNFDEAWPALKRLNPEKYTGRFYRMWKFYLLSSAGAFRARSLQLWQWVLSPHGVEGGYDRP